MSTKRELPHLYKVVGSGVAATALALILQTGAACHDVPTSSVPVDLPRGASVSSSEPAHAAAPGLDAGTDTGIDAGADAAVTAAANPSEPLYLGRFVTTARGRGCGWSGCEVRLRFRGTGVRVRMDTGWANRFRVRIDADSAHETHIRGKAGEDTYILAQDLPLGDHELSIVRITEAGFGEWHVRDFAIDGGVLLPRPDPPARRIEFIGDSITCGAGNTGSSAHCPLDQNTEDSTLSYAGLSARQLNASYTNICYSGRGVYRDAKGFTSHPMTLLWKRTFVQRRDLLWPHDTLVPDAVVVNLGTNDSALSYERERYLSAQSNFYKTLRRTYPDAHIVYLLGARKGSANTQQATRDLARWVAALGDESHASFLALGAAGADEHDGCAFHPGLLSHERMAETLVAHLRAKLHWDERQHPHD